MGNITHTLTYCQAHCKGASGRTHLVTSRGNALFTIDKQTVLALMFSQPTLSFLDSELIEFTGSGLSAVQPELKRLASCGLQKVDHIGKHKQYQANHDRQVLENISAMLPKAVAMVESILQALEPFAKKINRTEFSTL